jgi:hypothetical protein
MWTFMVSNKWFGDKAVVSPNYDESYVVTQKGTWVPERDAYYLETLRWPCAACGRNRIQVFARARATQAQMAQMPDRAPKSKKRRRRKKELTVEVSDDRVVSTTPEEE